MDGAPLPVLPAPFQQGFQRAGCQVSRRILAKGNKRTEQVLDRRCVVQSRGMGLLAEFLALLIEYDRDVQPTWGMGAQGPVNLLLLRRHVQQVGATHHVRDALINVINDHSKLIGVESFLAEDYRVIKLCLYDLLLWPEQQILPVAVLVFEGKTDGVWAVTVQCCAATAVIGVAPALACNSLREHWQR